MTWEYWICLYTQTHCAARGLRSSTIAAYEKTLLQFQCYMQHRFEGVMPDQVTPVQVLEYIKHLRQERGNGDSAVSRQATILKNFYRAMVAMGHLDATSNPLAHFPKMKSVARKLPHALSVQEVEHLLTSPPTDTVLGLRDRAILMLLYGTGIRASECSSLKEGDVDFDNRSIRVTGKGGHHRAIPMNRQVVKAMRAYHTTRGDLSPRQAFFQSRRRGPLSRNAIYDRVRTYSKRARIDKQVSPHTLRHTFATHLVYEGANLVTIRDLLGHRQITSTQVYLHVTANDLRAAVKLHPMERFGPIIESILPEVRLPFQHPPPRSRTG
jgi:integrase/recombinase XerD